MSMSRCHSQQKFIPKFSLERHKPYIAAFDLGSLETYYSYISKFLTDENISSDNPDDVNIFFHLMFDSAFGAIHRSYYLYRLKRINNLNVDWSFKILGKHINFLGKRSLIYQIDMFDTLFKDFKNKELLERFLKSLTPSDLQVFLDSAIRYSSIVEMVPKIKLYMLFS